MYYFMCRKMLLSLKSHRRNWWTKQNAKCQQGNAEKRYLLKAAVD